MTEQKQQEQPEDVLARQREHIATSERIINAIGHGFGINNTEGGGKAIMVPSGDRMDALAVMEVIKALSGIAVNAAPTLHIINCMNEALEGIYSGKPHAFDSAIEKMPEPQEQH